MDKGKNTINSVNRALELLDAIIERGRLSVGEASDMLEINRSSAYRLLETLRLQGYLSKNESNACYEPGIKIELAGANRINSLVLRLIVQDTLRKLSEVCMLDLLITQLTPSGMAVVHREQCRSIIRIDKPVNLCEPLYCSASGKAILAFLPEDHREYLIRRMRFDRYTEKTICDADALRENLARMAALGYAYEEEELYRGVSCVAVPVYDRAGWPFFSLGTSLPKKKLESEEAGAIAHTLNDCAAKIRRLLRQYFADPSICTVKPQDKIFGKDDYL